MEEHKLLIGITGSFGILALPSYLMAFRKEFSQVKIIMTKSATQFIPAPTFEPFADGIYETEFPLAKENKIHIELARWADQFIILPATAHLFFQVAHGCADTLLSATILSYEKKIIFFPNMNRSMWKNKALQRNVAQVQEDGHRVVPPLEKLGFEFASKQMEVNAFLPSIESVLSIVRLEMEMTF